jgi:type 1 glutamine amidotransferase
MTKPLTFLLLALVGVAGPAHFPPAARAADIVCITSEDPDNYDAVNFLEGFKERELLPAGHRVTILVGNQPKPTHFEGLVPAVRAADLLIVFVRRATPPQEQLDAIRGHLRAGRPLIGIRTANHGFIASQNAPPPPSCATWPEFTPEVLGCQNAGYETKGLPYTVARHPDVPADEPLLAGVDVDSIRGHQSLYLVLPLAADARPLLVGTAKDREPPQPVAWTRIHPGEGRSKIFYTSLGAPQDVVGPAVRRLLVNAVNWALAGTPQP